MLRDDGSGVASGDDVGNEIILDQRDLVLQLQLAFLQAGDLQLVDHGGRAERIDGRIEIAMLDA